MTIDSFDVGANLLQVGIGTTETTTDGVTGLAGGERDIVVEVTEVGAANEFNLDIGNGELAHSQASGVVARSRITYDGDDNIADGVGVTSPGLGSLDLSAGDAMLLKVIEADLNGEITLTVYEDDQTTCSTLSRVILTQISSDAPRSILFNYADFTTGSGCSAGVTPDFSDIDAIVVEITGPANFDVTLSKLEVVERVPLDFGDLPADYGITAGDNGASHIIGDLYLGGSVDDEFDGQPSDNANGDDLTGNVDDEDGVRRTAGVTWQNGTDGGSVDVQITGGEGCLMGWIDWRNLNGFSTSSRFGDVIINNEAVSSTGGLAGDGYYTLTFDIPSAIPLPGTFYARFRLFPRDNDGTCSSNRKAAFTGLAANGEVEDYRWQIGSYLIGDTVWLDENQNGVQDNGEHGIAGVIVNQLDEIGNVVATALTDSSGHYSFEVQPGTHTVQVHPSNFEPGGALEGVTATTDSPTQTNTVADADILTYDFGYNRTSAIGNRVWIDENNDGYQDAGEPGLPNVVVVLYDADGNEIARTVTDADGGYLFTDLTPGTYYVDVLDGTGGTASSLADGLTQTTHPVLSGADLGNQDHSTTAIPNTSFTGYPVVLGPGDENLTADFGYNWNTDSEVNDNSGTAALGDRVWIDANGNGAQEPSEIGVEGVRVELYDAGPDGLFDAGPDGVYGTADDDSVLIAFDLTDASGNYLFDDLAAGAYAVQIAPDSFDPGGALEGYNQTGDPDHFGTTGDNDNRTTAPVVLAPGDVFLNVDFGYQPPAAQDNRIGDTIWFDADGDGVGPTISGEHQGDGIAADEGASELTDEYGIAGVTMALIRDTNGDGIWDFDGADDIPGTADDEPIIGSDTTDANGQYLFAGLPDGHYLVWVNDTDHVLGSLAQTYDVTGPLDNLSAANLDADGTSATGVSRLDQDFGYAPAGHPFGRGSIGDTVFFDANNNGQPDAGEGIPGVTVELRDPDTDALIASTVTDADGRYHFGDLDATASYKVVVDTTTLPAGLSNTVDPDGVTDSQSIVDLGAPGGDGVNDPDGLDNGVNLGQDFGYTGTDPLQNSIGDRVWLDANRDGVQDATEPGIAGVTVQLTWAGPNGTFGDADDVVYTAVTDSNGDYLFQNLPDGDFQVQVLPTNFGPGRPLADLFQTFDATAPLDNTSTVIGLGVGDPNPASDLTQDFGYSPSDGTGNDGSIGDTVFFDANNNGQPDAGEGIPGVTVELRDPVSDTLIASTVTDADGRYHFGDLDATASYKVVVDTTTLPAGLSNTVDPDGVTDSQSIVDLGASGGDGVNDPDGLDNGVNLGQDFGYTGPDPLLNTIGDRVWLDANRDGVQDATEPGIAGVVVQLTWYGRDGSAGGGDDVVYTTVTDANGDYLFQNLPDRNFQVRVLPSNFGPGAALADLFQTFDATTPLDNTSIVTGLGVGDPNPASDLTQDFGYSPSRSTGVAGMIGDTIFLDANNNGQPDAGEGLEGITVTLLDGDGNVVATTTTDENGHYYFGNLAPDTYTVVVTPPAGLANTVDPDGGLDSQSVVTIGAGEVNLLQDFGYRGEGSIGDLVWEDLNANGVVDAGEQGIGGVTLDLYHDLNGNGQLDPGEPLVGSTTTAADGSYSFTGLSVDDGDGDAAYIVDVTDEAGLLLGWWHSLGTVGANDSSQADPYAVTLTTGIPDNLTADFGYYVKPASLGNRVWDDVNANGIQDAGEVGIAGATVQLQITYPDGTVNTLTTVTDSSGFYRFDNLLLDEDINGLGTAATPGVGGGDEPAFVISAVTPAGLAPTFFDADGNTRDLEDADNPNGVGAFPVQGVTNVAGQANPTDEPTPASYDFGFSACAECDGKVSQLTLQYDGAVPAHVQIVQDNGQTVFTTQPGLDTPFNCDKPIDAFSLIWDGTQTVRVKAWKGSVGSTLLADVDNIAPGDTVNVSGYAGSPNDVIWEIFEAGTLTKIGESTFHLSCSDDAMNGPEDCGKPQGNGKDNNSGWINDWRLDGMTDANNTFSCTVPDEEPLEPGAIIAVSGTDNGTFGNEVEIYVDGVLHTTIHTSCSQPIGPNLSFGDFQIIAGASDQGGLLCPLDTCDPVGAAELEFHDRELRWNITNAGDVDIAITRISIEWPDGNGALDEIKRDGDAIHKGDFAPPAAVIDSGWEGNVDKRTIKAGDTDTLKLKFKQHTVNYEPYRIVVEFDQGCQVVFEYVPDTDCADCAGKVNQLSLQYNGDMPAHVRVVQDNGQTVFTTRPGLEGTFACDKPIDELTMVWDGTQSIRVKAWKGSVGSTLLADEDNVDPGDEVTVSGYAGSPNDVIWEIFEAGTLTKIGESTFHLSCSDDDMDGIEDCGKRQGNGKDNDAGWINDWQLEGMVDAKNAFTCSSSADTPLEPGETFTFNGTDNGTFGNEIEIYVDDVLHTTIHTSCSQAIGPGLVSGDFAVAQGYSSEGGLLCPLEVCAPEAAEQLVFNGKKIEWNVTNTGDLPITISRIEISWPSANGGLKKAELHGSFYEPSQPVAPPSTVIDSGWDPDAGRRTLDPGETKLLKFEFENDVTFGEAYDLVVEFETGCSIEVHYTPPFTGADFACDKPIDALTMIWDGSLDDVWVTAWKGSVGSTALTTLAPVSSGAELTVSGYAGAPNDVIWQVFEDSQGLNLLGQSTFHLSCSDDNMNDALDCGKRQGNGKDNNAGLLNDWLLEGMVDSKTTLKCTAP